MGGGTDMIRFWQAIGAFVAVVAGPASAESIEMTGTFAASAREVGRLPSLTVERFAGRDGQALSLQLERLLMTNGHFRLSPSGGDGLVSGAVSASVQEMPYRDRRKECAEKVEKKCVREIEYDVRCTRRSIDLNVDVRVADRATDRIIYTAPITRVTGVNWCENGTPPGSPDQVIRGMIDSVARELAASFAPRTEPYRVKVLENDKGMSKEQKAAFKAAVKSTKRDVAGACAAWAALDRDLPNHPSVTYDLGICAEATGDLAGAEKLYSRAGTLGRGAEADASIARVRSLMAGREDAAARGN